MYKFENLIKKKNTVLPLTGVAQLVEHDPNPHLMNVILIALINFVPY